MIPRKVQEILDAHGFDVLEFEPGSTPTAVAAAEKIGVEVGMIAKSILMKGKDGRFRMFVLAGDKRINSSLLRKATGFKHSMSSSEETLELTGYRPGGVCPFGLEDIEVFLDVSLRDYDRVYPAAGTDSTGVPITCDKLAEITGGTWVDVSGHGDKGIGEKGHA
jgi:prolyl-tRNA editing enzyme YbaK/EbsC (Cys-tRNA(Pro) deacylase)